MWQMNHPDYEIKMWGEDELPNLELINRDIICNKQLNPALRADFLRLELLYTFGGIYADVDMTCEKSLTPLLKHKKLIAGVAKTQVFEINNGLLISNPANSALKLMIEKIS